jgi:hypothetical protein
MSIDITAQIFITRGAFPVNVAKTDKRSDNNSLRSKDRIL